MRNRNERYLSLWGSILIVVLSAGLLITGCSSLSGGEKKEPSATPAPKYTGPLPSDFSDIRLPQELKPVDDKTFFMQTGGFSSGVLALKGRVAGSSLLAFFENQMQKDNWQLVGFLKSSRSMMMFYKQNRWCVIHITEKMIYSHVEVWVAPTMSSVESRPLNPGESSGGSGSNVVQPTESNLLN